MMGDEDILVPEIGFALDPEQPSPELFQRLMKSVASTERFAEHADRVASLMDVAVSHARGLLRAIDQAGKWEPGPLDWIQLFHLEGGPKVANAIVGFIRLEPGTVFPPHTHLGEERVLILQGGYEDEDGTVYKAGELVVGAAGDSHFFTAQEGADLIYLVVAEEGLKLGDQIIRAGDPRL